VDGGGEAVLLPRSHCAEGGLTQIGEFSYVLVRVARDAHIVGDDMYNATLAASIVTILINELLIRLVPRQPAEENPESASPAS